MDQFLLPLNESCLIAHKDYSAMLARLLALSFLQINAVTTEVCYVKNNHFSRVPKLPELESVLRRYVDYVRAQNITHICLYTPEIAKYIEDKYKTKAELCSPVELAPNMFSFFFYRVCKENVVVEEAFDVSGPKRVFSPAVSAFADKHFR